MRRFTVTVLARDGGGQETTGRLRVNVLDINDNAPLFQKDAYERGIARLHATDEDSPPNNLLTYSITSVSAFPEYFDIVMVEGYASKGPQGWRATDEDSPPNNLLTYSITSVSAFPEYFDIVMVEGYAMITVNHPLDYELVPSGRIYLTDENDNPPTFSRPSYIVKIPENIGAVCVTVIGVGEHFVAVAAAPAPATSHQPPATSHQSPATRHQHHILRPQLQHPASGLKSDHGASASLPLAASTRGSHSHKVLPRAPTIAAAAANMANAPVIAETDGASTSAKRAGVQAGHLRPYVDAPSVSAMTGALAMLAAAAAIGSSQFRINARSGEITTTALLDRELKAEYILIVRAVDGGVGPQQKIGIATVTPRMLPVSPDL
ncbi:hypothetical protein CRUP_021210 [Coryphaenoides rupestris]|nr:hypothetical protein CRUP_021210 [Coryphaenoides rupestris]